MPGEVHFRTEEGAFAKAQVSERKRRIWGVEHSRLLPGLLPVSPPCEVGGSAPPELCVRRGPEPL